MAIEFKEVTELRRKFIARFGGSTTDQQATGAVLFDLIDELIEFRKRQISLYRCAHNDDKSPNNCSLMCVCGHACWQHSAIPDARCGHCQCKCYSDSTQEALIVPPKK